LESILTLDIGSTSMRAVYHDSRGKVLHKNSREIVPDYQQDKHVQLDAKLFIKSLLTMLKESYEYSSRNRVQITAISVTSQRSSVVPVDSAGEPLTPFITWHDKRTVPICEELQQHEDLVYHTTGLRISPVLSAVKMTWLKRERSEIFRRTAKMLGFHDVVLFTLCGKFVTDQSLASNTNLLNIRSRDWDAEMLALFSVDRSQLCDLVPPGSICGRTTGLLSRQTGIPEGTPVVSAGGDQQCSALGLGVLAHGKLKCTTGTGSYLIAHTNEPVIDDKKRFLCKIGAIPGTYNLEAGMLTTGTVYRWFLKQFYSEAGADAINRINQDVLSSPAGANGVVLLPHFEGSGAPDWNPNDTGVFYRMKLSTTRADMARAVIEGIVLEMAENVKLFKQRFGQIDYISVSGGMTRFGAYNQLQADVYGTDIVVSANRESTSLGAWISAAVTCGLYDTYEQAFHEAQPPGSEVKYAPDSAMNRFYEGLAEERKSLRSVLRTVKFHV